MDLEWEVLRYRRWQVAMIEGSRKAAVTSLLKTSMSEETKQQQEATLRMELSGQDWSDDTLSGAAGDFPADLVGAEFLAIGGRQLGVLEKMLASAERRRNAALREIETRRRIKMKERDLMFR